MFYVLQLRFKLDYSYFKLKLVFSFQDVPRLSMVLEVLLFYSVHELDHHRRPLIPLSGVGTICFLLPFSSITRHLHALFILMSSSSHIMFHLGHQKLSLLMNQMIINTKKVKAKLNTRCLVHTLSSRNLPMLKGETTLYKTKSLPLCMLRSLKLRNRF
jgi:hypothetical protein